MLEEQLNLVSGQIRHYVLLTNALVETNQDALATLLVKQKVGTENQVSGNLSKQNAENYTRKKKEVGIH